jgi:16S rRNA U1498 N3-methylase RsmE
MAADHAYEIARDPSGCMVHKPMSLKQFFNSPFMKIQNLFFLDPKGTNSFTQCLSGSCKSARPEDVLFISGAEGGFSADEEEKLRLNAKKSVALGNRILPGVSAGAFAVFAYKMVKAE